MSNGMVTDYRSQEFCYLLGRINAWDVFYALMNGHEPMSRTEVKDRAGIEATSIRKGIKALEELGVITQYRMKKRISSGQICNLLVMQIRHENPLARKLIELLKTVK